MASVAGGNLQAALRWKPCKGNIFVQLLFIPQPACSPLYFDGGLTANPLFLSVWILTDMEEPAIAGGMLAVFHYLRQQFAFESDRPFKMDGYYF